MGTDGLNKFLFFSKTSGIVWTGRQQITNEQSFTASSRFIVAVISSLNATFG